MLFTFNLPTAPGSACGYAFKVSGELSGKAFSGLTQNDSINVDGNGLTLGSTVGKDTVSGSISTSKFTIGTDYSKAISGKDVVLTMGANFLTFKEAAVLDTLTLNGATVRIT